ncbi:hypothetical protein [Halomicronema sp. CCY15110]|uniref:hypothetical protein n=1 Tax=Halomicronema sp. CCY15110 TaxID=2767773 RepID=UPI0019519E20|nr:hypothetical protein [Halomicronema sp. CCY15110]
MAALTRTKKRRPIIRTTALWFERLVAVLAVINFMLVLFDLSYIRFRDIYLRFFPEFTQWYGEVFKGITPERTTVNYLNTIDKLEEQVAQTGLQSVQAQSLLADLREQSSAIIDEDPFSIASKSGTLERIKNSVRDRVELESSKAAFDTFWSEDYLTTQGWTQEITYFNEDIVPLFETNYFRGIGENGQPADYFFWKLDIWFIAFFAAEMLLRSLYISRRYKNYTLLDAVLLRWYDLLFFLPFWRWLRVIPVSVRVNHSQLVNLIPLRNRINRIFVSTFAVELTEIVVLRIVDQVQNLIRDGDVAKWLLAIGAKNQYIDINGVDEVEAITSKLTTITIYQVLPHIKPEVDAWLQHSVMQALNQAPGFQSFRGLPGIGNLPEQISQQVISQLSQTLYQTATGAIEDEQGAALTRDLLSKIGETLRNEVQQDNTVDELEQWTVALLEEIKINYVQQLSSEDIDRLRDENYKLYDLTQTRR